MNEVRQEQRLHMVWLVLKISYGCAALIIGADKFFNYAVNWSKYLSPLISNALPISIPHIMYTIGVVEILVGLLILSKYTKLGASILSLWFLIIIANLLSMRMYYDIMARDLLLAIAAWSLAEITDIVHRK